MPLNPSPFDNPFGGELPEVRVWIGTGVSAGIWEATCGGFYGCGQSPGEAASKAVTQAYERMRDESQAPIRG